MPSDCATRLPRRALVLCLLALLIAACGAPTPGAPPPAAEAPTSAPTAAPAAQQPDPILVTTTNAPDENNPADVARHTQLVAEFKQMRPDVTIEARQGGFDRTTFPAKLAGGTMEDAYLVAFTEPQDLIARGYAADISELMRGWEHFASFNPDVLKIVQDQQGRIYGVPIGGYALGLIYNRKLFEQAGLDPDKPPATWDELREYAKTLSDPSVGRAGFAELSKGNQGGWHFTAWVYSFGGELQRQQDGKWAATFNEPPAVAALATLRAMRWEDQSLTEQQLLEVKDVLPLLATERVAMAVMAPDALLALKSQFEAPIEDFGMGPLPQAGGNATLAGGAAWMFNPNASPEVLQAAFEWTVTRDFGLAAFESDLQGQQERGQLVGWPQLPLFTGEFQQQRDVIVAKYANAPTQNYAPYLNASLAPRPEPPIETQKMYAILDTAVQAVLTDESADPQTVLDTAAREFQTQVLDQLE
jgi:ABC-type glycerol-3-phosphate transport system substrate-binding protein